MNVLATLHYRRATWTFAQEGRKYIAFNKKGSRKEFKTVSPMRDYYSWLLDKGWSPPPKTYA